MIQDEEQAIALLETVAANPQHHGEELATSALLVVRALRSARSALWEANPPAGERIQAAAVLTCGRNHAACLNRQAGTATTQGFFTSSGRFVDRFAALAIARAAGQLRRKFRPFDRLVSEDLW